MSTDNARPFNTADLSASPGLLERLDTLTRQNEAQARALVQLAEVMAENQLASMMQYYQLEEERDHWQRQFTSESGRLQKARGTIVATLDELATVRGFLKQLRNRVHSTLSLLLSVIRDSRELDLGKVADTVEYLVKLTSPPADEQPDPTAVIDQPAPPQGLGI